MTYVRCRQCTKGIIWEKIILKGWFLGNLTKEEVNITQLHQYHTKHQQEATRFQYGHQMIHRRVTRKKENQQLTISRLEMKVGNVEGKVIMLESKVHICGTVNENLHVMIDNQEQHSRRPCMVASGMAAPDTDAEHDKDLWKVVNDLSEECGIDEKTIKISIDKIHFIGVICDNGKQQRIIKFKRDCFKGKIFRNHKDIKRQQSSYSKNANPVKHG